MHALALLAERLRPTQFVEGEVRELARRRRAAAGTGARTNGDDMVLIGGVVVLLLQG